MASKKQRRSRLRPVASTLLCLGVMATIGLVRPWASADAPKPTAERSPELPYYVDGTLRIPDSYARRIGFSTERARMRTIAPVTHVTGELGFSPEHVAAVGTRIFGHVRDVRVVPGEVVEEGQALAELESSELGRAQADLLSARAREELLDKDRQRKELLAREGIAAHRSLEVATSELRAAKAQRRAAEQTVRALGGHSGKRGALGRFVLRAPIAGEVTRVNVYKGQAVQPDHVAFEVADLSHLWLELAVFERDLPYVEEGDEVLVRPHGEDDVVVKGRVEHVGSIVDPTTRTAQVRVRVDNSDEIVRVGQAVRASIVSRGSEVRTLAVPDSSVVLVDGEPTVFVSPADGQVVPRTVELGMGGVDHVEVKSGLKVGERVVVDGVFELKSELFR